MLDTSTEKATPEDPTANEWFDRAASARSHRAAAKRNACPRRRYVDPTTCERDYTQAEIEFMNAMHEYKRSSGRMFPTWSEVLEVIKSLGYTAPGAAVAA